MLSRQKTSTPGTMTARQRPLEGSHSATSTRVIQASMLPQMQSFEWLPSGTKHVECTTEEPRTILQYETCIVCGAFHCIIRA